MCSGRPLRRSGAPDAALRREGEVCCTLSLVAGSMPVWERSPGAGKALRACLTAMSGGPVGGLPQPGHLLEEGVDLVPIRVAVGRHAFFAPYSGRAF